MKKSLVLLAVCGLFAALTTTSHAATVVWNGGTSTNWADGANWSAGFSATDALLLTNAGASLPTYQGTTGQTILGITNKITTATTITGNAISIGAGGIDNPTGGGNLTIGFDVAMTAGQDWVVAASQTTTLGGVLSGGFNLTKSLGGTLVLSNANNTYTGSTTVNGGVITAVSIASNGVNSALGAPTGANATIVMSPNTTLALALSSDAATDRQISLGTAGNIAGFGLNNNNAGTTATFNGNITYSTSSNRTFTVGGAGKTVINGLIDQTGTGKLGFTRDAAGSATAGSGTTTLANDGNTFQGAVNIIATQAPTLEFTSVRDVGTGASALGNPQNATDGLITIGFSTGASPTLRYIGTAVGGHTTDRQITTASAFTFDASGAGTLTWNGAVSLTVTTNKVLTLAGSGNGILGGGLNESGTGVGLSVVKTNAGTWAYSTTGVGYDGTTTIKGGKLLVNTTHTGAGAYTVASGGTLGGNGTIDLSISNSSVTVQSGGKLAPGASAGNLTLALGTGKLDISGAVGGANTGALEFDLGALASSDKVTISSGQLAIGTGALDLSDFSFNTISGFGVAGTYVLFDTPNSLSGTLGGNVTGQVGGMDATLKIDANNDIVLEVIPEPATWVLVLSGLVGGFCLQRRRR